MSLTQRCQGWLSFVIVTFLLAPGWQKFSPKRREKWVANLSLSHSVCGTTLNKDVRLFIEYPSLIGCSTHSSKIEWADSKVFPCMPKKSLASPAERRFKQLRLKKVGLNVSTHWLIDFSKSDKEFWLESADTYKKCASDLICRNEVAELVMHASLPQTHFKRI